jgi:hypothetical protein
MLSLNEEEKEEVILSSLVLVSVKKQNVPFATFC